MNYAHREAEFFDQLLNSIQLDYKQQIESLTDKLGLETAFYAGLAEEQSITLVTECLKRQSPVLCFVRSKLLEHHILENPRDNLGAHCMVIYGYDEGRKDLYLADSYQLGEMQHVTSQTYHIPLSIFMEHLIGFAELRYVAQTTPKVDILSVCRDSIHDYFYRKMKQSNITCKQALTEIIMHVGEINGTKKKPETSQNNYISLIFLLKAYITSTFPYLEQLDKYHHLCSSHDEIKNQIKQCENGFISFFMRCLSAVGSAQSQVDPIKNSGLEALASYQALLYYLYERIVCKRGEML